MTPDTVQFIYRFVACVFAVTGAIALLAIIGIDGGAIFHFGDGEAISLIGQLNGPLIAVSTVLGSATIGHQLLTAILARLLGVTVPVAPPSASSAIEGNSPARGVPPA